MINKKFLIGGIAGTVVLLTVPITVFAISRKRLRDELTEYVAFIKEHGNDSRSVATNKGFDPAYWKTALGARLPFEQYNAIADDIHSSWGVMNDDEDKVYAALGRLKNLVQLSQVSDAYYGKYRTYLLSDLTGKLNKSDEIGMVWQIVNKLK